MYPHHNNAKYWYKQAAAQGSKQAAARLQQLQMMELGMTFGELKNTEVALVLPGSFILNHELC